MPREKIYLTPEQKTKLVGLEDDIKWLDEEIRRAKLVGLDVADLEERFKRTTAIRARMLTEYVR